MNQKVKTKEFPAWPYADETELKNLEEVLNSHGWWRTAGSKVKEFEKKFAEFHNVKYALGVSNGTHAIEISLNVLGIGKGDEVIVPAFTFISTATAVLYCNAEPVFCDVDPKTFCMDPSSFEKVITKKTKAVIPVHMGGQMCNMEKIREIAQSKGIKIIEDAAHAHGAEWNNKKVGYYSDIATFSFQNRKIMSCGEGGAIITNDEELYYKAYLMHSVGRPDGDIVYDHRLLGSNDRMSEFHAAVLLGQLERVEQLTNKREKNARLLNELLKDVKGIVPQEFDERATINTHYMYMFYYDKSYFGNMDREKFVERMKEEGIPCLRAYPLIFNATFFKNKLFGNKPGISREYEECNYPNAYKISKESVWLPHNTLLGDINDLEEIKEAILKIQNEYTMS